MATKREIATLIRNVGTIQELALVIQDEWPYASEIHALGEQIYELANKLETLAEEIK